MVALEDTSKRLNNMKEQCSEQCSGPSARLQVMPEQGREIISHCDGRVALLDGSARVFVQLWISVMPRVVREAYVVREGAWSHGCSKEKDFPVSRGHAPQPSGSAARGPCGMPELRGDQAASPYLQPLRALRRARGRCSREAAAGRRPGLSAGCGVLLVRP
jgi:hypothetical protein